MKQTDRQRRQRVRERGTQTGTHYIKRGQTAADSKVKAEDNACPPRLVSMFPIGLEYSSHIKHLTYIACRTATRTSTGSILYHYHI